MAFVLKYRLLLFIQFLLLIFLHIKAYGYVETQNSEEGYDQYTLEQIISIVRAKNLNIKSAAEDVYQARLRLKLTMGLLLPRLSFNTSLLILSPGALDAIPLMLGFIYPNNWFMWEQNRYLFEAQRHQFATLIANEINTIEVMVYQCHALTKILAIYQAYLTEKTDLILKMVTLLVEDGVLKPINTKIISTTRQMLMYDIDQIKNQIRQSNLIIANALALPHDLAQRFSLAPVDIPDLTLIHPVETDILQREAVDRSHDLLGYNELVDAAKTGVYKQLFEFISPTAFTIFAGFGYGYSSYIKTGKSQVIQLERRREQLVLNTHKAVALYSNEYNLALNNYHVGLALQQTAKEGMDMLIAEIENGGVFDITPFVKLLEINLLTTIRLISNQHSYLVARAQLDRLTWRRSYYADIFDTLCPKARPSETATKGLLPWVQGLTGGR